MNDKQNDKAFVIRKKHYLVMSCWFVFGMLFLFLTVEYNELFLIPFLILFLSVGFWYLFTKCPKCKKPIFSNPPDPVNSVGMQNYISWTPWLPTNCTKCGLDFD